MTFTTPTIVWPEGRAFAFTVHDDTDSATLENVGPVYSFLADCGFRATKSCWVFRGDPQSGKHPGQTLDDPEYRQWLLDLESLGFGIDFHGASWCTSPRARTAAALKRFEEVFGHPPYLATNHTGVAESIYWGSDRLTGWRRFLYNLLTCYQNHNRYRGQVEGDEHFWGDLCREKITYLRSFVFRDINTLKACPFTPYHDPAKPYVNNWFASSDGGNVDSFNRCLSEANQDRLESEGGACIMYTHFAKGFCVDGRLNPRFRELMLRLSKKNGWYVRCRLLLDHLLTVQGRHEITDAERATLERKWLWERIHTGTT